MSSRQKQISVLVLLISTVFWPIVAPISYLELLTTKKHQDSIANYGSVKTAQIVF